jgi:hypothetical protein
MVLVWSSQLLGVVAGRPANGLSAAIGFVAALAGLLAMGCVAVLLVRLGSRRERRRPAPGDSNAVPDPSARRTPQMGGIPARSLLADDREPWHRRHHLHPRRPPVLTIQPDPPPTTWVAWRFGQFLDMGFEMDGALELAQGDIDVHLVRALLGRGCPSELAARIVAPLSPAHAPERRYG